MPCAAQSAKEPGVREPATIAPAPRTKVVIRLTWKVKGEYAPLYVALQKGYYANEGLDVELAEGSGSETVVKLVGAGTENIAYGSATVVGEAVNQGMPVEVVAIYQPEIPMALASFPDLALATPKDLEGKRLGISTGEAFGNMLEPFARLNGFDVSKVTVVRMENSARNLQFLVRKLDVTTIFLNNELPLFEKRVGVKFNVLKVADFGLKLLGSSFIVNSNFARNNPELLRKLLRATAKGYLDAKLDPRAATLIMDRYMTAKIDQDVLEQQIKATLDATPMVEGKPIGWQSDAAWMANLQLLKVTNAIRDIKDLRTYYTNDYLR
jgi:NitT/TauT family transport system substrate-binding protein